METLRNLTIHVQRPILYHDGVMWLNRNLNDFYVEMGSFDSAKLYELVMIYLLWELGHLFELRDVDVYRDEGLIIPHKKVLMKLQM